jgi:hypothetical protein
MKYEAMGRLALVKPTKVVSPKFSVREFVLEIKEGKYPQLVQFQVTGDRCEELDTFNIGQSIDVSFDLRGREWTGRDGEKKFFNSLNVFKIAPVQLSQQVSPVAMDPQGIVDDDLSF